MNRAEEIIAAIEAARSHDPDADSGTIALLALDNLARAAGIGPGDLLARLQGKVHNWTYFRGKAGG